MYQSQNVEPDKFRQAVINFNEFTFLSTSEKELIKHNPELLQKFWQFLILLNIYTVSLIYIYEIASKS